VTVSNDISGDRSAKDIEILSSTLKLPDLIGKNHCTDGNNDGPEMRSDGVVMRRRVKKRRPTKRLSIINGHCYDVETSIFVPSYGCVTSVTVTTLDCCPQVIRLLLDKFKVENYPEEYCLCIVRSSGETRALADTDIPLLERIFLGPLEDDAKIFIVERHQTFDITEEVAAFVNLPEAVLIGFLEKCKQDEEKEIQWIRDKYNIRPEALELRLAELVRL
jgi:Ras association domain-containing protein 2/4